jgi:Xaa-Pro aminopeptidase
MTLRPLLAAVSLIATALAVVAGNPAGQTAATAPAVMPPAPPFAPSVYAARREKVMKEMVIGLAVLYARGEEDRDGYLQDSDFYYLTGLDEPGAVLVLAPEERIYRHQLYLTPRDLDDERWTGERPDIGDSLRKLTGIDRIGRTTALKGRLLRLVQTAKTLWVINAPGSLDGPAPPETELYSKLQGRVPGLSTKNGQHILPALRSVKEPAELERMELAIRATVAAHRAAARLIKPGVEENWVEAAIGLEFKRGGAVRPAFSSIVGSGRNSTVLHYPKHDQKIAPGALVVVDIGADYGHYAADVTRTYPADGRFTAEQRRVYEVVLKAQQACIDMIKPGVYYEDIHRKAEEIIAASGHRDDFIHGLGHFVGLDVHDAGLYYKPLQAGMVITTEPGIYIRSKSLGVRIEDEVLVTTTGHRLLTEALPRDPDAIEKMMRGE